MRPLLRWAVGCGVAAGLLGAIGWALLTQRDPLFRGKPESQWIAEVERAFGSGSSRAQQYAQVQLWRSLGPEGRRLLERALSRSPPGRAYARLYRLLEGLLPNAVLRWWPQPKASGADVRRIAVLRLLWAMREDGWPSWPVVARLLSDEDASVRYEALLFFIQPPRALLRELTASEKTALVPALLRLLRSKDPLDQTRRLQVLEALSYFGGLAAAVGPALAEALQDPAPSVQLRAAESLCAVDPDMARKAGVLGKLIQILEGPDPDLAARAATDLRHFRKDADLVVTALAWALEHTNSLVACRAIDVLESGFVEHKDRFTPALQRAAERSDQAGYSARVVLRRLRRMRYGP